MMWWLLNIVATAGLATVGEALSLRIELREINLRGEAAAGNTRKERGDVETGLRDAESGSVQNEAS